MRVPISSSPFPSYDYPEKEKPIQHIACKYCGQVHADESPATRTVVHCARCGSTLARRTPDSLHKAAAFTAAALILYIPANVFPILRIDMYGAASENTVWSGCVHLFQDGDWAVAAIVFLASMVIPLVKLICLLFLIISSWLNVPWAKRQRTWLYRAVEAAGRWAMLDVFVVAVLVALVKLQGLATVIAGNGLIAFCGVVVMTILASASFDPVLIWEKEEANGC